MTGPAINRFAITCEVCSSTPYTSDATAGPAVDRATVLNGFSKRSCPQGGGLACPYSDESLALANRRRPDRLAELVILADQQLTELHGLAARLGPIADTAEAQHAALGARIDSLGAEVARLRSRTPRIAYASWITPLLAIGTREVALSWIPAFTEAPAEAVAEVEPVAVAVGGMVVAVRALTATTVTISITTTIAVAAGARVKVLAAGWMP